MCMTERGPEHNDSGSPIDLRVLFHQPGEPKNHGHSQRLDDKQLYSLAVISR